MIAIESFELSKILSSQKISTTLFKHNLREINKIAFQMLTPFILLLILFISIPSITIVLKFHILSPLYFNVISSPKLHMEPWPCWCHHEGLSIDITLLYLKTNKFQICWNYLLDNDQKNNKDDVTCIHYTL